ncbi:MAG: metal ABC transporter substrate-binding protein, partial [Clostridia bacterium]|nr:metal ABC transporter substrate-binding protein [Clostridia bacterium]
MKKFAIIALAVVISMAPACAAQPAQTPSQLSIVAAIFPAYDFARAVAPDADVTLLLPPGADCHSYEPTAKDIIKIQNCDLLIYNGGPSDAWIERILSTLDMPIKTLKMMDCVTLIAEEDEDDDEHDD